MSLFPSHDFASSPSSGTNRSSHSQMERLSPANLEVKFDLQNSVTDIPCLQTSASDVAESDDNTCISMQSNILDYNLPSKTKVKSKQRRGKERKRFSCNVRQRSRRNPSAAIPPKVFLPKRNVLQAKSNGIAVIESDNSSCYTCYTSDTPKLSNVRASQKKNSKTLEKKSNVNEKIHRSRNSIGRNSKHYKNNKPKKRRIFADFESFMKSIQIRSNKVRQANNHSPSTSTCSSGEASEILNEFPLEESGSGNIKNGNMISSFQFNNVGKLNSDKNLLDKVKLQPCTTRNMKVSQVTTGTDSVSATLKAQVYPTALNRAGLAAVEDVHDKSIENDEVSNLLAEVSECTEGDSKIGAALQTLAVVYSKNGKHKEAVSLCDKAVKVKMKSLGEDHHDVAQSLAKLGIAHLECNQYNDALTAFLQALQIRRKLYGDKHPKTAKILNNIGCTFFRMKDLHGAKLAFEETLEIQQHTWRNGKDLNCKQAMLNVADALVNVGSIQLKQRLFGQAILSIEEALLIQQSALGDEHEIVLQTISTIDYIDRKRARRLSKNHEVTNLDDVLKHQSTANSILDSSCWTGARILHP